MASQATHCALAQSSVNAQTVSAGQPPKQQGPAGCDDSPTKLPIATRAAMAPHTAAMPALPRSVFVRSRLSRMTGSRAAGAKVDTKAAKKASQLRWKAGKWGFEKYQGFITRDLCSESSREWGQRGGDGWGECFGEMGLHRGCTDVAAVLVNCWDTAGVDWLGSMLVSRIPYGMQGSSVLCSWHRKLSGAFSTGYRYGPLTTLWQQQLPWRLPESTGTLNWLGDSNPTTKPASASFMPALLIVRGL
jgi:hypothetical protein